MLKSSVIGRLSDEIDNVKPQCEIDEESLHMVDQQDLLKCMSRRSSEYELTYLFKQVKSDDVAYWETLLSTVIKNYSLNSLKLFVEKVSRNFDLKTELIKLIIFIKVNLIRHFELNELVTNLNREYYTEIISKLKPPFLMKHTLLFIDNESLDLFIKKLKKEILS